jgi:pyrroloquinoline quinone biosynthesis protein B
VRNHRVATVACSLFFLLASVFLWLRSSASAKAPVRAVVLGIAQDGGVPHIGCEQELCVRARRDGSHRQRVASLGLIDDAAGQRFLIDATPDLSSQIADLRRQSAPADRRRPVDGILLTHAHIGHYAGLMYLGREALGSTGTPVYATPRMASFLRANGPWSQLVSLGNIELREMEPGKEFSLSPGLWVTPLAVPHRDEFSDTVAFRIRGPSRRLLYVPDIDKWERWERKIEEEVAAVDVALLDGTFFEAGELPGRSLAEIPHPLVEETVRRLPSLGGRVWFVHLNHTNRLLWDRRALRELAGKGFHVARDGEELPF